jgi:acetyl-CoA C-acetyltransferase
MRSVALALENALAPEHDWRRSASDLAIDVAGPLIERAPIDCLFVAAPAALLVDGQAAQGAVLADRLGLTRVPCYQLEAGDASGAAALHAAVAQIGAGLARAALVVAVSKVSDRSERERAALLDSLIDREVEAPLGLTYQALCGLLADLYVTRHGLKAGDLAHVVAKNAANAVAGGETFLPHAPSAIEVRRDIPVAPPLVRSDFAPLFDTATALVVAEAPLARELAAAPVEIAGLGAAGDVTVLADRPEPLRLEAAARAASIATGVRGLEGLAFLEVSSACSILEILAVESIGVAAPGTATGRYKDGLGRAGSPLSINPGGGAQGRGFGFGSSGLEQAREALLQLGGGAGKRQVAAAEQPGATALSVCLAGLGSQAFATLYRRPTGSPPVMSSRDREGTDRGGRTSS